MPVQRKIFRIEESGRAGARAAAAAANAAPAPQHDEFLSELKALRALIEPHTPQHREAMERARAQVAEADAFRAELAAIHGAVEVTRAPMQELEGAVLRESQLRRAGRELDALVAGTEQATQIILRAVESIQEAARALDRGVNEAERTRIVQEIGGRAVQILQACDFQDLTGQQASNVVDKLQRVEAKVVRLVEIWRRVGQFQPVIEEADDDQRFLNGPKLAGDAGHSSQHEIDALFAPRRG
jgi:chemotaxis protein CheZ